MQPAKSLSLLAGDLKAGSAVMSNMWSGAGALEIQSARPGTFEAEAKAGAPGKGPGGCCCVFLVVFFGEILAQDMGSKVDFAEQVSFAAPSAATRYCALSKKRKVVC